ncbi:6857_t:CDS:2 [Gigaspora margarita]|uniref:6857_t:CDS:1 n=1 Tax=Gigaspora margarita TaxID=4874 RepID=A0ABN7WYM8_GIGMA|nr:6857_t:CDS:2 [Gigaspora margarita]
MPVKLFSVFSQEIKNLLTDSDEYNVIIYVGKDKNVKTFKTHSLILKARCSYYKTALSEQWAKQNDGNSNILRHPNFTPHIFKITLKNTMEVLEILAVADELLLSDLLDFIQSHLIETKSTWLHSYASKVYQAALFHDSYSNLREFISITIDVIWPFRVILPAELENDIIRCHLIVGGKPTFGPTFVVMKIAHLSKIISGYNPIRWQVGWGHLKTKKSFLFSFKNKGQLEDAKISRVRRPGYAITLKDKNYGPCFGDKDLWMHGDFS